MHELDLSPPRESVTPWLWVRKNLFSTWYNVLLTIACLVFIPWGVLNILTWVVTKAQWLVVQANWRLFLVGRYPPQQSWRLAIILGLVAALVGSSVWLWKQWHSQVVWLWVLAFPIILWLIGGGLGLRVVRTSFWNGLLLTLLAAVVSILLSFPLGLLLALGRQSALPVIRWICTLYIEIVRGLPLIGILFLAQVMLPLVLPSGVRPDRVARAIAGLTLFSAAYLAENVRGGLQAIPKGQIEAARSLGLSPPLVVWFIILPQALRISIPAIVGQFIGLFKDTSLLSIFALVELTGIARSILAQPDFIGRNAEVFLFIGVIYWLFCYSLSLAGRRLERQLERQ
jgi:general L-amino acid transport system permease protein